MLYGSEVLQKWLDVEIYSVSNVIGSGMALIVN